MDRFPKWLYSGSLSLQRERLLGAQFIDACVKGSQEKEETKVVYWLFFLSGAGLKVAGVWRGGLSLWQIKTKCCHKWYCSAFPLRQGICKVLLVDFFLKVSLLEYISDITMCDYSLYQVAWRDVTRKAATRSAGARHPSAQPLEPSAGTRRLHPRPVDVAAAFLLNQWQLQQHLCVGLTQVPTAEFPSPLQLLGLRFTRESTRPPQLCAHKHTCSYRSLTTGTASLAVWHPCPDPRPS